jgi:hypothetical protein
MYKNIFAESGISLRSARLLCDGRNQISRIKPRIDHHLPRPWLTKPCHENRETAHVHLSLERSKEPPARLSTVARSDFSNHVSSFNPNMKILLSPFTKEGEWGTETLQTPAEPLRQRSGSNGHDADTAINLKFGTNEKARGGAVDPA